MRGRLCRCAVLSAGPGTLNAAILFRICYACITDLKFLGGVGYVAKTGRFAMLPEVLADSILAGRSFKLSPPAASAARYQCRACRVFGIVRNQSFLTAILGLTLCSRSPTSVSTCLSYKFVPNGRPSSANHSTSVRFISPESTCPRSSKVSCASFRTNSNSGAKTPPLPCSTCRDKFWHHWVRLRRRVAK